MSHAKNSFKCCGLLLTVGLIISLQRPCYAVAWSNRIAQAGTPIAAQPHWPGGVLEFLNDPTRTEGWSDGFSEWPNDVCHYLFQTKDIEELNALLVKFAKIKSLAIEVRLASAKEPKSIGWITKLPAGKGTIAVFSIGNQQQIRQWYGALGEEKQFGQMRFRDMPVAVPPTLTIYVENPAVDLDKLKSPRRVAVTAGSPTPPMFKDLNLVERTASRKPPPKPEKTPMDLAIERFIARREMELKTK